MRKLIWSVLNLGVLHGSGLIKMGQEKCLSACQIHWSGRNTHSIRFYHASYEVCIFYRVSERFKCFHWALPACKGLRWNSSLFLCNFSIMSGFFFCSVWFLSETHYWIQLPLEITEQKWKDPEPEDRKDRHAVNSPNEQTEGEGMERVGWQSTMWTTGGRRRISPRITRIIVFTELLLC